MKKIVLILNVFALCFYFFISYHFGLLGNLHNSLFSSPDSISYRNAGNWIYGFTSDYGTLGYRPFFYPLLLGMRYIFSDSSIWLMQFVFWLVSINLIAASIFQLTKKSYLSIIGFFIMTINVSFISLTYHALTETTVILLVSLWLFTFAGYKFFKIDIKYFLLILILSLLTVTKPVYSLFLYFFTGLTFLIFLKQKTLGKFYSIGMLLALMPILIQLAIVWNLFHTISISTQPQYTFKAYLFAKIYANENKLNPDLVTAGKDIAHFDDNTMRVFIIKYPYESATTYINTLVFENMLEQTSQSKNKTLITTSFLTNSIYFLLHILMLPLTIFILLSKEIKRVVKFNILILYIFFAEIVLSAGVSFWQGDRLIIPTLPIWIVIYAEIIYLSMNKPGIIRRLLIRGSNN